jgi:hypothetical protein
MPQEIKGIDSSLHIRSEAAGVCGGRGALWDLNGGLGRESFVSEYEKVGLGVCALGQRAAGVPAEGRESGRGHWVSTRMR